MIIYCTYRQAHVAVTPIRRHRSWARVWSPAQRNKSSVPTSTPLIKKMDQDSMAVNYNEETKLSLNETGESLSFQEVGGSTPEKPPRKFCNIM
ncbi:hypothetical protein J6590_071367 [Homalodisca vitripennis]|nr:hypothetical protein J6590_071367 [Homalodisca vitripennis]